MRRSLTKALNLEILKNNVFLFTDAPNGVFIVFLI